MPQSTRDEFLARQYPPEEAAVRHGVFLAPGRAMMCKRCPWREWCAEFEQEGDCAQELRWQRDLPAVLEEDLRDLRRPVRHSTRLVIAETVDAFVHLQRAKRAVTVLGILQPDRDGRGFEQTSIAKQIPRLRSHWLEMMRELGLTPAAEAKMAREATDAAEEWAEAIRRAKDSEQAKLEAVDAEFVAEEEIPAEELGKAIGEEVPDAGGDG